MKTKHLLFITILFFFSTLTIYAQTPLPDSPKESAESYIYTINKDNLRKIYLKKDEVSEDMLEKQIAKYKLGKDFPVLKKGNYIIVRAIENRLSFTDYVFDDLHYKIVPAENFMLCLYDSTGTIITDAVVKCGSKTLRFDQKTRTYNSKNVRNEQIIEINNKDVYHYIEITRQDSRYYLHKTNLFKTAWRRTQRLWYDIKHLVHCIFNPDDRPSVSKYKGFIVLSKPKYKPGEIVKLKAYITKRNDDPTNKPLSLRLYNYHPHKIDTILKKDLLPYRPGMYEYQFKLNDSLNLKLDNNYTLSLEDDNHIYNAISEQFVYEEYELKSIRLSVNVDKKEYAVGDSVKIKLKVSDENDMAVYGGRAEIYVTPLQIDKQKKNEIIFIPDTLWSYNLEMNDIAERTIVLPDSIFPGDVSLLYRVNCIYLSADNERKMEFKTLYRNTKDHIIDFSLSKGMLTIQQLHKGKSQEAKAEIRIEGENTENIKQESVLLPYTLPIPWYASDITVRTKETEGIYDFEEVLEEEQLGYNFYRSNDSVYLQVDNPASIPFWYRIRKGKKEIATGYTTRLNYSIPDYDQRGYHMQLSYLFGGTSKQVEQALPFTEKNITMNVFTPTTVYPGQKTNVLVSVADKKGKPVKDVDITAYSFTAKFENYSMPYVNIKGKARFANSFITKKYMPEESEIIEMKTPMTWNKWKTALSLDTIEYYKFLYPDIYYKYTQPSSDGSTLVIPYIVIDGALQGVYMLWIDDKLYYTNLAEQMDVYAFHVEPGMHNLRFRTFDREILVYNANIDQGVKNILSFNAGKAYIKTNPANDSMPLIISSRLLDKKEHGILSYKDVDYLSSQLITIDNNFGKIELPNTNTVLDIPAYIHSGNTFYYLNHTKRNNYNHTLRTTINTPVVAGPFPTRSLMNGMINIASVYADNNLIGNIEIEGKNRYTLYNNYQKIANWEKLPFRTNLSGNTPVTNFKQELLTPDKISLHFAKLLQTNLSSLTGSAVIANYLDTVENISRLNLFLGKDKQGKDIKPSLIFIIPEKKEEIGNYKLYYGGTRNFTDLPQGKVKINFVFSDSLSYSKNVSLCPGGENHLSIDSIEYDKNNEMAKHAFKIFNRNIKKTYVQNPYIRKDSIGNDSIVHIKDDYSSFISKNAQKGIITGIVVDDTGEPLIGVSINVEGTTHGTITDLDGKFELEVKKGDKIRVNYLGYISKTIPYSKGANYVMVMEEDSQHLDEVIVVGYGTVRKQDITGAIDAGDFTDDALKGKIAGIMIRGGGTLQNSEAPLIIVNGLPYNGKLEDIDSSSITSMNVLKDASATSIYGARAANGVIMIQTNALSLKKTNDPETVDNNMEAGNNIRRNFHDDAFWQPRLRTNEKGEASFEVTYPDDITSWNAYFIAIGNKDQSDKKELSIKSFKALTARLSMPRFAIRGDSLNAVGRIANYLGDSIQIKRKIEVNNQSKKDTIKLATSHTDYIPVKAETGDSLAIIYSLQMENGYLDGEERDIPVFEQGMMQTYGDFSVINNSDTHTLKVNPSLGAATIYAEATSLELFLREIEKVDKYPYMCNEQMASKIKALLSKKQIATIFGTEFKEEKKIKNLISRLSRNKNSEGKWGWWNKDKTELWISKQVMSAMLDAEDAGYKTELNKKNLAATLEKELNNALDDIKRVDKEEYLRYARQELLDRLILLKRLNATVDYEAYFKAIDSQLKSYTTTDKLKTMETMSVIGMLDKINTDSLMHYAKKTILGSIYWGDDPVQDSFFRMPVLPFENAIENTLIGYNILKNKGGHEEELTKIRNYFFECRNGGYWQNTYESSRILETIMPDMLKQNESFSKMSMYINDKKITKFPYSDKIETTVPIHIRKEGTMPLFITAYQQAWNKRPEYESKKGFSVQSYFVTNKDTVSYLTSGKTAQLEVLVHVEAEANYVQIEIPIPAGCTYESKKQGWYQNEVHREHFKEKVVIFSNKLTKGEYKFTIDLIARYTGKFHLNPANAELMYFPTFYGNEVQKIVEIQ